VTPARSPAVTTRSAWHDVPRLQVRRFAAIAMAEAPSLAEEILSEIRREYPHLPVVLDESGEPMALVGIRRAIEVFVQHLEQSEGRPSVPPGVFQEFGRGEGLHGRSLDSLQAIYRMGVRLAWRRFAEIGQRVEIPPPAMYELVDAGYEYLDGLVDQSVRGYAEAAARQAGERLRLQRRLLELLLAEHHRGDPADALTERAARVGWPLPRKVAVGVLLRPARRRSRPPWDRRCCSTWSTSSPAWSCRNRTPPGARSCCTAPSRAGRAPSGPRCRWPTRRSRSAGRRPPYG